MGLGSHTSQFLSWKEVILLQIGPISEIDGGEAAKYLRRAAIQLRLTDATGGSAQSRPVK